MLRSVIFRFRITRKENVFFLNYIYIYGIDIAILYVLSYVCVKCIKFKFMAIRIKSSKIDFFLFFRSIFYITAEKWKNETTDFAYEHLCLEKYTLKEYYTYTPVYIAKAENLGYRKIAIKFCVMNTR